jgi:hypothetical protein
MQRDIANNILVVNLGTVTLDSTGDDDGSIALDTKGARSVTLAIDPPTLTTQVTYVQILESSDDGDADAFSEIAEEKYLPEQQTVEFESDGFGQLLVEGASNYEGDYTQLVGCFGTERYIKPRFHTDTSQASIDVTVYAIMEMDSRSTLSEWNPNVTDVDNEP